MKSRLQRLLTLQLFSRLLNSLWLNSPHLNSQVNYPGLASILSTANPLFILLLGMIHGFSATTFAVPYKLSAQSYSKYITCSLSTIVVWCHCTCASCMDTEKTLLQYCWLHVCCGHCIAMDFHVTVYWKYVWCVNIWALGKTGTKIKNRIKW